MSSTTYIEKEKITNDAFVKGGLVTIGNEEYYKISNSHLMRPFFMSIVSDSNHWMFISSNGGLTAGRKNSDFALFPYYTDDKITESVDSTGSKAIFRVSINNKTHLWEPFSIRQMGLYTTHQNLYKNTYGNKIIFEEINEDLGLTYRYKWSSSNKFGFIKESTIINNYDKEVNITILDGLQNIIPASVGTELQNSRSNLVDAYKRNELNSKAGIGIYALSAVIVDKAEPSEALKANTVWSFGLENPVYLLSSLQLDNFRQGLPLNQEEDIKAEKGAYFVHASVTLEPRKAKSWNFVANVNQSITNVVELSELIENTDNLKEIVERDIQQGTKNLISLTGASDGLQITNDALTNTRHFANTLFNIMRGGIFDDNYQIEKGDFLKYISRANTQVSNTQESILNALPDTFSLKDIKQLAESNNDKDFARLCLEYLPLKFSRRHGDPSRPWNKFSINTRNEIDGSKILDYQGNWRDIFQNWEALAHAYPEFIESMIHKFLNATTFDGYNPYRVTKDGFDWEVIEEHDPWSYIGYWGDHQIIYLLKFLEFIEDYYPGKLETLFEKDVFVYANVPYKIKSYQNILVNPKDTIDFDYVLDKNINKRKKVLGADAALLTSKDNNIYHVNFIEKILATVLAKVCNFIPEGGIWLNTQRPEWNDANNALVGNGVSMVTLYYLERFLNYLEGLIANSNLNEVAISKELKACFDGILLALTSNKSILSANISNKDRKIVLDGLGTAGSTYRETIYNHGFSNKKLTINKNNILDFIKITKQYLEHSIRANKRADNLYHAYNLMTVENDSEISISYLPEMLEGQVAVLSSGYLSPKASLTLLDGLKNSALFRHDQYSYILYPNKNLPGFEVKNNISKKEVEKSALLSQLIKNKNTQIVEKDVQGHYHFNGNFNNASDLKKALNELPEQYKSLKDDENQLVLDVFEKVFNHKAFTGRSGTFFGYEGLGSIYWHMVSKLLLAVQENCLLAINNKESEETIGRLLEHYYEIQAGIGVHKSPELYGAFPTDPYSHTPATKGAQQPGMTGQVKEDVLCRIGELGTFVKDGKIHFNPKLLRKEEFITAPKTFHYINVNKEEKQISLGEETLCFTYCQIPVVYKLSEVENLKIIFNDDSVLEQDRLILDENTSKQVFERTGTIKQIEVSIVK
ncbi:hypothetical protein [Seonamhaeicola aphaedonensis]|uniref:Cellobiose phosphorylase n=1 Tax=Seonamhaeicola aphaedonensis TaxID=1461338 RepID=A0A3D9HHP8_9FLAO|nr:hypothetical protein [Seonamhaeicola aphaedonensis]RED48993.1 hypothetical protein DFQ02_103325 [Seonamhaeicola aphaedonensis]